MNFLAHLHLADPDPELMLGGIVADFARNPEIATLPAGVQRGVRLHRFIDGFTDRHPVVHRSITRVSARLGWFAGLTIDIYYDHILARDWSRYATEPLRDFTNRAYSLLETLYPLAPPDAQHFIRRFIDNDQLFSYSTPEGIATTRARLATHRGAHPQPRSGSRTPPRPPRRDLDLAADFHAFYPELMAFAAEQRNSA